MKYFFISYILVAVTIVSFAGFRGQKFEETPWQIFPDMDDQAKVKPQRPSDFFANGHGMRMPVAGTMPMGFEVPAKPADVKSAEAPPPAPSATVAPVLASSEPVVEPPPPTAVAPAKKQPRPARPAPEPAPEPKTTSAPAPEPAKPAPAPQKKSPLSIDLK